MVKAKDNRARDNKGDTGVYNPEFIRRLRAQLDEWEQGPLKDRLTSGKLAYQGGLPKETSDNFTSGSGEFPVNRVYTPLDVVDNDIIGDSGFPGQFPYTRGRDPVGYRAFNWPLTYYAGYGSGDAANQRYRQLLAAGAKRLSLALDLPTQVGLDSDDPLAEGEVGKVGVALGTVDDLERALEGIPLAGLDIGTVGNSIGPWMLALFLVLLERRGIELSQTQLHIQNDPIKEYIGRGTFIFKPEVSLDLAADVVEYMLAHTPWRSPQQCCTTPMSWGGVTASQEIGFGIANLALYADEARKKGISAEDYISHSDLHMTSDNDLFEEVAKFRAARRLWAKIARERFKTDDPRALAIRTTVWTSSHKLTAQEPLNNVIRITMQVLAAYLGGCDVIYAPAYDEALALPTFESTRLSSLITHILQDECFVGTSVDPMGGSYYLESLTNKMEEKARYWYDKVQSVGGAKAAIEKGYYLEQMANGQFRYQQEIESGNRKTIGVNKFVMDSKVPIDIFKGDPEGERRQIIHLKKTREDRDNARVEVSLNELMKVAEAKTKGVRVSIMPAMMEAVRARATGGEIHGKLSLVYGKYKPPIVF